MKKIAIAIPTHDYNGKSSFYFSRLLNSIQSQSFNDYCVYVSDQSENTDVLDLCINYKNSGMDIHYVVGPEKGNPTENINNSLIISTGSIIKPMFMDDFFYDDSALEIINEAAESEPQKSWGLCSTNHFDEKYKIFERVLTPYVHEELIYGVNTMGCPSVSFYRKRDEILFDNNLRYLVDTEWYYSWNKQYGPPIIVKDNIVSTSMDENSTSGTMYRNKDSLSKLKHEETVYCVRKHLVK